MVTLSIYLCVCLCIYFLIVKVGLYVFIKINQDTTYFIKWKIAPPRRLVLNSRVAARRAG